MLGQIGSMEDTFGGLLGAAGGVRFAYTEEEIREAVKKNLASLKDYIASAESDAVEAAKRGGAKDDVTLAQIRKIGDRAEELSYRGHTLKRDVQLAVMYERRASVVRQRADELALVLERGRFVNRTTDGRAALQGFEVEALIEPWTPHRLERRIPEPRAEEGMGFATVQRGLPPGYATEPLGFEAATNDPSTS